MNLILIDEAEILPDNSVILVDRRSEHIVKVLKSSPGDTLKVGIINGRMGTAVVHEVSPKKVVLLIGDLTRQPVVPQTDLILAMPRPIMLKRVLTIAATLGVRKLYLINANRVEKSYFSASLLDEQNIRKRFMLGLEQAIDTRLPEISIHKRFKVFIEDSLPSLIKNYSHQILAHPETKEKITDVLHNPGDNKVLLAIGPEGGWVDYEVNKFIGAGFKSFSMGARILKVDTAVPALLSQIEMLRRITLRNP